LWARGAEQQHTSDEHNSDARRFFFVLFLVYDFEKARHPRARGMNHARGAPDAERLSTATRSSGRSRTPPPSAASTPTLSRARCAPRVPGSSPAAPERKRSVEAQASTCGSLRIKRAREEGIVVASWMVRKRSRLRVLFERVLASTSGTCGCMVCTWRRGTPSTWRGARVVARARARASAGCCRVADTW